MGYLSAPVQVNTGCPLGPKLLQVRMRMTIQPGVAGQAQVILNVYPLSVVEGSGFDCKYRTALLGSLPPVPQWRPLQGERTRSPTHLPPCCPLRNHEAGAGLETKTKARGLSEGPGPGPRQHGPTIKDDQARPTNPTDIPPAEVAWSAHRAVSARGSPSPCPCPSPRGSPNISELEIVEKC